MMSGFRALVIALSNLPLILVIKEGP